MYIFYKYPPLFKKIHKNMLKHTRTDFSLEWEIIKDFNRTVIIIEMTHNVSTLHHLVWSLLKQPPCLFPSYL